MATIINPTHLAVARFYADTTRLGGVIKSLDISALITDDLDRYYLIQDRLHAIAAMLRQISDEAFLKVAGEYNK